MMAQNLQNCNRHVYTLTKMYNQHTVEFHTAENVKMDSISKSKCRLSMQK